MHLNKGFTLIEISIVLVIIGLIVGGVLVGRDLIKAAEIRSTIAELDKMNAAMNTFRLKYNGLPGDLEANKAAQFGMASRSGADGHGDDDRMWEGCSSSAVAHFTVFGCETALIWRDLAYAQLLDGNFDSVSDTLTTVSAGTQDNFMPNSKLRNSLYYNTFSIAGLNFLFLANVQSTNGTGQFSFDMNSGNLSPSEAHSIDQKVDDGKPWTGRILASSHPTRIAGATTAVGNPGCTTCSCTPTAFATSRTISGCAGDGNLCDTFGVEYNFDPSVYDSQTNCQLVYRIR